MAYRPAAANSSRQSSVRKFEPIAIQFDTIGRCYVAQADKSARFYAQNFKASSVRECLSMF